jgi:hypothetical protein
MIVKRKTMNNYVTNPNFVLIDGPCDREELEPLPDDGGTLYVEADDGRLWAYEHLFGRIYVYRGVF